MSTPLEIGRCLGRGGDEVGLVEELLLPLPKAVVDVRDFLDQAGEGEVTDRILRHVVVGGDDGNAEVLPGRQSGPADPERIMDMDHIRPEAVDQFTDRAVRADRPAGAQLTELARHLEAAQTVDV
jgi:hypothetical protein